MATAYIMRYGRLNAEGGPGGGPTDVDVSLSNCFDGDADDRLGEGEGALVNLGGSMDECDVGALDGIAGSGNAGISSSVEEVSIVICFVGGIAWRSV